MKERQFSAKEVHLATGATLRRLQWWDEKGVVTAARGKRGYRSYTAKQVAQIERLLELRSNFSGPLSESAKLLNIKHPVIVITKPTMINGIYVVPKANWSGNAA